MKNNANGITLIALLMTVLLILMIGTITINMALGERGFLYRAHAIENDTEKNIQKAEQDLNEIIEYFEQSKNQETQVVAEKGALTLEQTIENIPKNGTTYAYGEKISYEVKVKNIGNIVLRNIQVENVITNAQGKSITKTLEAGTIQPQEIKIIKDTYTVTGEDLGGTLSNKLSVKTIKGVYDGDEIEKSIPIENKKASLQVAKEELSTPSSEGKYQEGESITYQITITNDGNIPLKDITLHHTLTRPNGEETYPSELTDGNKEVGELKPGEKYTITYKHTIAKEDLGGTLNSLITVQGVPQDKTIPEQNVQATATGSVLTQEAQT